MSWASQRKTTKVEDMSYCLLGLFEVNMPMLYGEGSKAFLRLQREIIEQYDDESIFAWREQSGEVAHSAFRGILAKSPSQFADCGNIVQLKAADDDPNSAVRITSSVFCAGPASSSYHSKVVEVRIDKSRLRRCDQMSAMSCRPPRGQNKLRGWPSFAARI